MCVCVCVCVHTAAFKNRNTGKNVPTWNGKDLQANDPHPYTLDTTTTTSPATTTKPASEGASAQGAAKEGARDPEAAFTALAPKSDKPAPNAAAALRRWGGRGSFLHHLCHPSVCMLMRSQRVVYASALYTRTLAYVTYRGLLHAKFSWMCGCLCVCVCVCVYVCVCAVQCGAPLDSHVMSRGA